jgi:2'-5' RNA ligase
MERTIRCFIALDLPESILAEAILIQDDFKKHDLIIGNYTKPENIHLTLKFLGEISQDTVEKVKERLRMIEKNRFDAEVDELGVFSEEFIRILWLHLAGEGVIGLQKAVDAAIKELFPEENRFQSHITVARVHNVKNKEDLLEYVKQYQIKRIKASITSFSLMKSTLTAQGAVYEVLERYSLG